MTLNLFLGDCTAISDWLATGLCGKNTFTNIVGDDSHRRKSIGSWQSFLAPMQSYTIMEVFQTGHDACEVAEEKAKQH